MRGELVLVRVIFLPRRREAAGEPGLAGVERPTPTYTPHGREGGARGRIPRADLCSVVARWDSCMYVAHDVCESHILGRDAGSPFRDVCVVTPARVVL